MQYARLLTLGLAFATITSAFAQANTEFESQGLTRRDFRSVACTGFYATASFKCVPIAVPGYVATASDGKHKAVVFISHGSGGLDRRHGDYAHYLATKGFDAVVLDHWSARGVSKAHLDYNAARAKGADAQNMAIDALAAASQLIQEDSWKSARFGFVGESMGGSAAINVTRAYIEKIVEDQLNLPVFSVAQLAASVALYPGCIDRNTAERFKTIPLLILQGEKDDQMNTGQCERQAQWMNGKGGKAKYATLPGEHHDFDAPYRLVYSPNAQNPSKCENVRDGNTFSLLATGKQYPATPQGQNEMREACFTRGLWSGNQGNPKTGYQEWTKFLIEQLLEQ